LQLVETAHAGSRHRGGGAAAHWGLWGTLERLTEDDALEIRGKSLAV
jgi:hypothetical protein